MALSMKKARLCATPCSAPKAKARQRRSTAPSRCELGDSSASMAPSASMAVPCSSRPFTKAMPNVPSRLAAIARVVAPAARRSVAISAWPRRPSPSSAPLSAASSSPAPSERSLRLYWAGLAVAFTLICPASRPAGMVKLKGASTSAPLLRRRFVWTAACRRLREVTPLRASRSSASSAMSDATGTAISGITLPSPDEAAGAEGAAGATLPVGGCVRASRSSRETSIRPVRLGRPAKPRLSTALAESAGLVSWKRGRLIFRGSRHSSRAAPRSPRGRAGKPESPAASGTSAVRSNCPPANSSGRATAPFSVMLASAEVSRASIGNGPVKP